MSDLPPPPPQDPLPPPPGFGAPPPGYTVYGQDRQQQMNVAGFWIRFAAVIVDTLIYGIPVGIVMTLIDASSVTQNLVSLAVAFPYFVLQESSTGQTIGKRLCNIKVVDESTGQVIDAGRASIRYLVSIVSGAVCALGYLWMLWDERKQTWHDKASQTYVIKV